MSAGNVVDATSQINQPLAKISQTDHFIGSRLSWRDFRGDLDLMRFRYGDGTNYLLLESRSAHAEIPKDSLKQFDIILLTPCIKARDL